MTWAELIKKTNERLQLKRAEYEDYKRHHAVRTEHEDLHGMWDCSICMAESSSAIDELETFAADLLNVDEPKL